MSNVEINLQVRWDSGRDAWVIDPWGYDSDSPAHKPFDVIPASEGTIRGKRLAIAKAETLGKFLAAQMNTDGSCELVIRTQDGRIQDKRTYGHDPEAIKG